MGRKIVMRAVAAALAGAFLAAAMPQCTLSAYAAEEENPSLLGHYHYELEQVGSFERGDDLYGFKDLPYLMVDKSTYAILGTDGTPVLEDMVSDVEYLANGLYLVKDTSGQLGDAGILDYENREMVVPFGAAMVERIGMSQKVSDRYLAVYYATEESEGDAVGALSTYVGYDRVAFDGYYKVYDMQKRRFVPNVESDIIPEYDEPLLPLGNSFLFMDEYGYYNICTEDGEVLDGFERVSDYNGNLIIVRDQKKGSYLLIDEKGETVSELPRNTSFLDNSHLYYYEHDDKYHNYIYNLNDLETPECVFDSDDYLGLMRAGKGLIKYRDTENKTVYLLNYQGELVMEMSGDGYYVEDLYSDVIEETMIEITGENAKSWVFVDADGGKTPVFEPAAHVDYHLAFVNEDGDFYVYADGDYTLHLEESYDASTVGIGLLGSRNGRSKSIGLFDLFTGSQLLDCSYYSFTLYGKYLFAYDGNNHWTTYTVELVNDRKAASSDEKAADENAESAEKTETAGAAEPIWWTDDNVLRIDEALLGMSFKEVCDYLGFRLYRTKEWNDTLQYTLYEPEDGEEGQMAVLLFEDDALMGILYDVEEPFGDEALAALQRVFPKGKYSEESETFAAEEGNLFFMCMIYEDSFRQVYAPLTD